MSVDMLARFQENRPRLFGLAYRILGEAGEAEDVLQDAYLRWERSSAVEVPEAWLTKVVTNLCLNRLDSARARREVYVGPWLPEPVLTDGDGLGPLETVEQRETLSFGVLMLMERLTPPERAVFVLREAFGHGHREIADILEITEENARALHHRAKAHIGESRKRFTVTTEQSQEVVGRFLLAALEGDVAGLERLLAEDVVAWSDGGGKATAARKPVHGRNKVARFLIGLGNHPKAAGAEFELAMVNGVQALIVTDSGAVTVIVVPEFVDGLLVSVGNVVNPDKLAYLSRQRL